VRQAPRPQAPPAGRVGIGIGIGIGIGTDCGADAVICAVLLTGSGA